MSFPLMPMSPQQIYIVKLITTYLADHDDPDALEIWRLTQTKRRPVKPLPK